MSKFKIALSVLGLACVAAPVAANMQARGQAQAQASGEVLARDLYHEQRGRDRLELWEADARLARYPVIFRAIRASGLREVRLGSDCSPNLPCNRNIHDEFVYAGTRLLSTFSSIDQFTGGAHGSFGVSDGIYDLRTNRKIRFGDLFTSWSRAKPLLQTKICEALRQVRPEAEGISCPDADTLAFGLTEVGDIPVGGPASGFEVRMSDYAMGSYAAGREDLYITLDRPIYNLIKPEYRGDFRVAE